MNHTAVAAVGGWGGDGGEVRAQCKCGVKINPLGSNWLPHALGILLMFKEDFLLCRPKEKGVNKLSRS